MQGSLVQIIGICKGAVLNEYSGVFVSDFVTILNPAYGSGAPFFYKLLYQPGEFRLTILLEYSP